MWAGITSMGWRTFRILTPDQKPVPSETMCRNVRTDTACQVCGLCGGTSLKAEHVAMQLHGSKRVHFYRNVEMASRQPPALIFSAGLPQRVGDRAVVSTLCIAQKIRQ